MELMMPVLETERLRVRPLTLEDTEAVYQLLDVELADANTGADDRGSLEERRTWVQWTVLSYDQYARLYQPPLGERAVVLRETDELVGLVGVSATLNFFGQIPGLDGRRNSVEFGLYYAFSPRHQGRGYATEAAGALVRFLFEQLQLGRVVATTTYDNLASQAVMRKLGMRVERNPLEMPPWLQVVGILEAPEL